MFQGLNLDHMPVPSPANNKGQWLGQWFSQCSYRPAPSESPRGLLEMPVLRPLPAQQPMESKTLGVETSPSVIPIQVQV